MTHMLRHSINFRPGERNDAVTVAALSVQVFLGTYATEGVRADLARAALRDYSEQAFLARLANPGCRFVLAEAQSGLVGFAEVDVVAKTAAVEGLPGCELVRLYVQPQAQRSGIGAALLNEAEVLVRNVGTSHLWLTVWEDNLPALAFYARMGYADAGATVYSLEGREYGNRVVAKRLSAG